MISTNFISFLSLFTRKIKTFIIPECTKTQLDSTLENKSKDLDYFKNKTFFSLALVFIFAGGLTILVGSILFFIEGYPIISIFEIVSYLIVSILLLNRKVTVKVKKGLFVLASFLLSIVVLIFAGSGPGLHIVLIVIVLSGCIIKTQKFKLYFLFNVFVFIIISILLYFGFLDEFMINTSFYSWIMSVFTLQLFGYGTVIVINQIYLDLSNQNKLITEREEELLNLTYTDTLTGLYNRRYFEKIIQDYNNSIQNLPISIIIGDINGLKLINDAFGHDQGDKIIKDTATILTNIFKDKYKVSRTGGDEFTIVLLNSNKERVEALLLELDNMFDEYNNHVQSDAFRIEISLGYSVKTKISQDINQTIKNAEELMYKRKLVNNRSLHSSILNSIKATMTEKSNITKEHAQRLAYYTSKIAQKLNLNQEDISNLLLFSELHDLGKFGIDDTILKKDRKLSEEEWSEMKKHPEKGYRIAMSIKELEPIAELILSHHEKWDGKGYPRNLHGENIPLLSRILSVVDAYDAMTNDRPYRKAMTKQQAMREISDCSGSHFDPFIADIFLKILSDYN